MSRRFLVICRAGNNSLHREWLSPKGVERNFDLWIDYFGNEPGRYLHDCERYFEHKGLKWARVQELIDERRDEVFAYDAVWIPDDDLSVDAVRINEMFLIFAEHHLDLAQPALTVNSYYSHKITLKHAGFILRYTNFVEVMAPLFSQEALKLCLPTFNRTFTGWGLDVIWPKILSGKKIAVIDQTPVRHTRPIGGGEIYKAAKVDPREELREIIKAYGVDLSQPYKVVSGVIRGWGGSRKTISPGLGLSLRLAGGSIKQRKIKLIKNLKRIGEKIKRIGKRSPSEVF